ncbi:MAG: hypothetical protein IJD35_06310 [Clostridia bacterium]|nr:hypothetical protein [Clostridia bacterium]
MSILELMIQSEQKQIKYVDKDGVEHKGYVDVYESRYDNDGEASICFAGENGEMLIVYESEIESIEILDEGNGDEQET